MVLGHTPKKYNKDTSSSSTPTPKSYEDWGFRSFFLTFLKKLWVFDKLLPDHVELIPNVLDNALLLVSWLA